jgi:erythronate-4-phosphate dehydrogenase
MKIVADENIVELDHLFEPHGKVLKLPGRDINRAHLVDADALLVRSVTRVDHHLLDGTSVKFIGSCTSGVEHIDVGYLHKQGIQWSAAPGCNANAVTDYVVSVLVSLGLNTSSHTVGIIGCGYVGRQLFERLEKMNLQVVGCDPFVKDSRYVDLQTLLGHADVVSLHTPLTTDTLHPTHHMINSETLAHCRPGALFINACRGAVIDTAAMIEHIKSGRGRGVFDVWENEPDINRELLELATLATPHIAGYSREGKTNGTRQVYRAFCRQFEIEPQSLDDGKVKRFLDRQDFDSLRAMVMDCYNPETDDIALRGMHKACDDIGPAFDRLRKQYPARHEFSCYQVSNYPQQEKQVLQAMGFAV